MGVGFSQKKNWKRTYEKYRTSRVMPCHLLSFLVRKAGMSIRAITATIRGISTTSEAFMPAISLSAGIAKGLIVIAIPLTKTRLKRFAPRMFPRERDE